MKVNETVPAPMDDTVAVRNISGGRVAARPFFGFATQKEIQIQKEALVRALGKSLNSWAS